MWRLWSSVAMFYVASAASADFNFDFEDPSSSNLLTPNNLTPDSYDVIVSCGTGLPADSESLDASGLFARTYSDSEFPGVSADLWDPEAPPNPDDSWSSIALGGNSWLPDLTMDPAQFNLDGEPSPKDAPPNDICAREPAPSQQQNGLQPPWTPIDPEQPDHDCLDDSWEKWCCPLGISRLIGTNGCVPCICLIRILSSSWRIH